MKVSEICIKEMYCASPNMTLNDVAGIMKRHGVGIVPVCNDNHLLGVITDRDIVVSCVAADANPAQCQVREFMSAHPVSIESDIDIEEAAEIMGREQVRRLPVAENGRLVGMLSLGDLATALPDKPNVVAGTVHRICTPVNAVLPC